MASICRFDFIVSTLNMSEREINVRWKRDENERREEEEDDVRWVGGVNVKGDVGDKTLAVLFGNETHRSRWNLI